MLSELKSETSRINGAKSHGPKTPEGKEASSRNAIKHGLTTRSTILLHCESRDEFEEFLAEHIEIHQPVTAPEKELADQMAIARWRIRRFVCAETMLLDCLRKKALGRRAECRSQPTTYRESRHRKL